MYSSDAEGLSTSFCVQASPGSPAQLLNELMQMTHALHCCMVQGAACRQPCLMLLQLARSAQLDALGARTLLKCHAACPRSTGRLPERLPGPRPEVRLRAGLGARLSQGDGPCIKARTSCLSLPHAGCCHPSAGINIASTCDATVSESAQLNCQQRRL